GPISHVEGRDLGRKTLLLQGGLRLPAGLFVEVGDDHVGTRLGQALGTGGANASSPAGDHRALSAEVVHFPLSPTVVSVVVLNVGKDLVGVELRGSRSFASILMNLSFPEVWWAALSFVIARRPPCAPGGRRGDPYRCAACTGGAARAGRRRRMD